MDFLVSYVHVIELGNGEASSFWESQRVYPKKISTKSNVCEYRQTTCVEYHMKNHYVIDLLALSVNIRLPCSVETFKRSSLFL